MVIFLFRFVITVLIGLNAFSAEATSVPTGAQANVQATVPTSALNEVIFSEADQSWTARDLQLYEKLVNQVLRRKTLSPWSENITQDFLLSRLVHREAILFGVSPEKDSLTQLDRKALAAFSKNEIEVELLRINYINMFINLKENQLKQKERFITWFSHLRRKYQARMKVSEVIQ